MGGRGQFSPAFSCDVYDFYSVSLEYFGYTLVHIRDCVETVYELSLLPNNTASETFLQKS
jgi:hypothetical protein